MIDPASVAFDIDGVIADTMTLFLEIARDAFQIDGIRYEDISCYNLAECIPIEPEVIEAVVGRILDGEYQMALQPIDGAGDVLTHIGRDYGPLLLVTARPYPGPMLKWFQDLLPLNQGGVELVATGSFENKADILKQRKITCFVEDRLETCYRLEEAGIMPVLFKQPWNRQPHPFVEVDSWKQLESLIEF